jgi:allantoin racemase
LRVLVANPNATESVTDLCIALARAAASPGVEISGWTNREGPPLVDSWYADYFAGRPLLTGLRAVTSAPDAVVLAGFGNYGTAAVKEALDVPVVAMAEAAMAMAMPLCHRFAIVTTTPRMVAYTEELVSALGFRERCAAVSAVTMPPLGVSAREDALLMELATEVDRLRVLSRADLVVLGGSRLSPFADALRKLTPLTVLEPVACAVQLAESLVRLGLTQSKSGKYAPPPQPFESYD